MGFDDDAIIEDKINKIVRFIPEFKDFQRMLAMTPEEFAPKPEYTDAFLEEEWERARYKEFRFWNHDCLWELVNDGGLDHVFWLCTQIVPGNKLGNMDMEACCVFSTGGIFFDNKKRLVFYNAR